MKTRMELRLRIEATLGVLSAIVLLITLMMPDWIERVSGFAPDGGEGSVEWSWAIFLVIAAGALLADARRVRLRSARAFGSTK